MATIHMYWMTIDQAKDTRSRATMLESRAEAVNGHLFIPYVYGGRPPSHPGLCDGCGFLNGACRCQ